MHLSTDGARAGSDPGPPPGGAGRTRPPRRRRPTLGWLALALGCTALLGALLALVESHWGPLARADQGWTDGLHRFARSHTAWTASMQTLTDIGGPLTMRALLGAAAVWLWAIGARMLAGWVAAQALVGWLADSAGKAVVGRARPHFADPVSQAAGASFPSGHALAAAVTCATLVVLVWPRAGRAGRSAACAVAALAALTVGWTRVALGVHWPSDVLAGWLAAGVVLGGVTVLAELWRPGALGRDVQRVDRRTGPRVQRVLVSGGEADPDGQ
ncbi:hypothetical protein GCM10009760_37510 [Kitasatospora kazusensis]|uniref:Phosphatidic acid phosphatase type 2/haloperoxidase domain-containing protein n=1 Tax=Kitasatospora kazusensis TaxID=407974 RepID=A0ABN2ZT31_9ACTN